MEPSINKSTTFSNEDNLDLKQELNKYVRYWPWFLLTLLMAFIGAYIYLRYAPRIYQTTAKMKILDESDGLELPTSAFVFKRTNINLENEIEILTSYLILEKVAKELKLNSRFYEEGTIQTTQIGALPFYYEQIIQPDSIFNSLTYVIEVTDKGFDITNAKTEKSFNFPNHNSFKVNNNLPFQIKTENQQSLRDLIGKRFVIKFGTLRSAVLGLKSSIKVESIGEQSDLLKMTIKGESKERSEWVLNTLMDVFNRDGINDRQLVSKRTLEFIDARFEFLAEELDSIEIDRKEFKQNNNLVNLAADVELGLLQRSKSDEEVFQIESQLAVAESLQGVINSNKEGLLPTNIGIESGSINSLINEYNAAILVRDKLASSGGANNPTVQLAQIRIDDLQSNITKSLSSYNQQLIVSRSQLRGRNRKFVGQVSQIPRKEKLLRAIERQQKIKESLYLLLLQKREEAAINLAITEPSIKVVDYALSSTNPISPKSNIIYAGGILVGFLIPFGFLYLIFILDTKVHGKEDMAKLNSKIPLIGEIPDTKKKESLLFINPNDRSILAESFRILSSNVNYMLPLSEDHKGKVIYCTSTIKGEGKTYISLNLSLALSSLNKKVLLIGADLRNPQIHSQIKIDKNSAGLSNYLHEASFDWRKNIVKGFDKHPNHDILLSGSIPPNPSSLLTNGRFKELIKEAKEIYDYIVVDTAPTILVTDTMLISSLADVTVYIARASFTDKKLLAFSKDLSESGKLKNMAYVINGVGHNKSYGYNYGYNYGYGTKN
ncbi:polysaccharide biosynthesis tyrosine autokinase [Psychroserpens burtonensis]|uniref:non-specific protein-tyrosine kinase n=1 Tax=Psychroserpens burtonensis TaxID=49278 RepID=A0A5C7BC38_9FLAO|nr:tyrosine-protein kinase family protein [Psychroserpens burtonensis]TXE18853.1 polysaccharide biosynthesis tyrosine autokinase [Psychroserpens burtonensis]